MASNLRVDNILPSNGTNIGIGTANGSVTFLGDTDISTTGDVIIAGNLGVGGTITYEDVARVDATGISTFREGFGVGPLTGIALTAYKDGSIRTTGIITASSFSGNGAVTINNNANNRLITGSGTANTLEGESTLTYDGSNVLEIASSYPRVRVKNTGTSASANDIFGAIEFEHSDSDDAGVTAKIQAVAEDNAGNSFLAFYNGDGGNADERLRIGASGQIGIGGANYGTSGQVIKSAGSGAASSWGPMAFSSFAVICDKKGANDDGGSATAGNYAVYDVRNLNHELADPDSIVSISSNQFTLVAGTYWVEWRVPGYGVDMFTAELINVTDGTGNRGSAPGKCDTGSVTYCHGSSYFTISASKTFEIRQHNQTARSGNGLGVRAGYSNNSVNETFYTFVYIYKK